MLPFTSNALEKVLYRHLFLLIDDDNTKLLCILFRYGIEGPVYLTSRGQKGSGEWIIDEQQQKIKKTNGEVSYGVLQPVRIHMEVVEPQPNRPKLELTLI